MKFKNTLIIGLATLTLISCNDFLDVDSPSSMGHRTKRILRIERKEYQTY